ncbi:MAG TPA: CPXCG motif-containing cysteine-rich protein [Armatimonadota bacterium]|jgi:hypothetical protein|nr:CPXCG motif-containing cysteine-rich protein [Armatimonadota bacterium]
MDDLFFKQDPDKDDFDFEEEEDDLDDGSPEDDELDISEMGDTLYFVCDYCGEENELFVDRTVANRQQFTEDCEVCCRPNLVTIVIEDAENIWIDAEREDDA